MTSRSRRWSCSPTPATEPVQALSLLSHDSAGDACEALVRETLAVDLAPLRAEYARAYGRDHGTIVLRFDDGDSTVDYTF